VHRPLQTFLNTLVTVNRFWQVLLQPSVRCCVWWKNAQCVWQILSPIFFAYTPLRSHQSSIMCPAVASLSGESLCRESFIQCRSSLKDETVQLLLAHCTVFLIWYVLWRNVTFFIFDRGVVECRLLSVLLLLFEMFILWGKQVDAFLSLPRRNDNKQNAPRFSMVHFHRLKYCFRFVIKIPSINLPVQYITRKH
jgi:hypothetical protein